MLICYQPRRGLGSVRVAAQPRRVQALWQQRLLVLSHHWSDLAELFLLFALEVAGSWMYSSNHVFMTTSIHYSINLISRSNKGCDIFMTI